MLRVVRVVRLLPELAFIRQYDINIFEVEQNLHERVLVVLQKHSIIEDFLIIIIPPKAINGRHVKPRLLIAEIDVMCEYLSILRIDQDSLISQNQLSLLLLTLRRHNGDVVPDYKFLEVFLDDDNLLMQ